MKHYALVFSHSLTEKNFRKLMLYEKQPLLSISNEMGDSPNEVSFSLEDDRKVSFTEMIFELDKI